MSDTPKLALLAIPAGLEDLLPRFLEDLEADCRRLEMLAGGERTALAEHAHAMRGKCALFGAEALAEELGLLENRSVIANVEEINQRLARVLGYVPQLRYKAKV